MLPAGFAESNCFQNNWWHIKFHPGTFKFCLNHVSILGAQGTTEEENTTTQFQQDFCALQHAFALSGG
jgi:hypothetical protein